MFYAAAKHGVEHAEAVGIADNQAGDRPDST